MPSFTQSAVRQPQALVQIQGQNLPCISASVTKTSKRASDTFRAQLSITLTAVLGFDEAFWASQDALSASILMSTLVGDTGQTMVSGEVDEISIDWVQRTVDISGRDKSGKLTETRRSKKYNNQKVSDVVTDIASSNGLNPVISGATDTAGKNYDIDEALLVVGQTDFETLSKLAEGLGFRWYVDGNDLHFEPTEGNSTVFELIYRPPTPDQYESANFVHLTTRRNLRASKSTKVTVKSWHPKTQQLNTFTATAPGAGDDSDALNYEINGPMLSQDQVKSAAMARAQDVIRHELALDISMPGDLSIDVTQKLSLSGTGTIYDQSYDIDQIEFEIAYGSGLTMHIQTKSAKQGRKAS